MISINFFNIDQESKDNIVIESLLNQPKANLQTINYGVLSMIASTPEGCEYLLKYEDFLPRVWKVLKQCEKDTVLQRFALAIIQKLSGLEKGSVFLLQQKYCQYALDYIEDIDPAKEHSFVPIYMISTMYNIMLADANQDDVILDITQYCKILKRLIQLLKKDMPGACYTAILEIIKAFNRFNPRWEDFEIEAKINSTLKEYLDDFENVFNGKFIFFKKKYILKISRQKNTGQS